MREKKGNTSEKLSITPLVRNKTIYIAIGIIIFLTAVAISGVYYEYW